MVAAVPTSWPLTGRDTEMSRLADVLAAGGAAVVSAAAGLGKTRLVDEAAAASGRPIVRLAATVGSATMPLGVFLGLVPEGLDPMGLVTALLAAIASAIRSRGPGVCLVVDDAHHLDDSSAALIHQLHLDGVPILATLRSGARAPDAVTALWKSDRGARIQLDPLSDRDVATLLERALRGQVDTGTVHRLARRSGGNPLFLRELTRAAIESGVLDARAGVWRLAGPLPFGDRLADLVPMRLDALPEPQRRLVELLALGEPLEAELLRRLSVHDVLIEAEEGGLITVDSTVGQVESRLAHPLYGDAVRAGLSTARRLRRFGELADAIRDAGVADDLGRLRLGLWDLEAGRPQEVSRLLALARLAAPVGPALAERFVRAAVAGGGGVPAALELANLLAHGQRHDEAESVLAGLDPAALSPPERVMVAATRAMSLSFAPHRPDAALAVLDATADLGPVPMLQAIRATALMRHGQCRAAAALAEPLARDESLPASVRLPAAFGALAAHAMGGRPLQALALAEVTWAQVPAAVVEAPEAPSTVKLLLGYAHYVAGELDAEQVMAQEGHAQALAAGSEGERLQFAQVLGRLAIMRGRPRVALRHLRETQAGDGLWWQATLPWTRALLAEALVLAGRAAAARRVIDAADAAPCSVIYAPMVLLAGAYVDAAEGAVTAAIIRARRAGLVAAEGGEDGPGLLAWYGAVRLGDRTALAQVEQTAARMDGRFAPAIAAHARAIAANDAAGHERSALVFEALGARWFEAEARAMAVSAYRAAGRRGQAALAAERLRRTLTAIEPLATPALAVGERFESLTRREAEVARLAAHGLADREIADRLAMSVRTAQTHLARVYAKLGMSGRRELVAELGSPAAGDGDWPPFGETARPVGDETALATAGENGVPALGEIAAPVAGGNGVPTLAELAAPVAGDPGASAGGKRGFAGPDRDRRSTRLAGGSAERTT